MIVDKLIFASLTAFFLARLLDPKNTILLWCYWSACAGFAISIMEMEIHSTSQFILLTISTTLLSCLLLVRWER